MALKTNLSPRAQEDLELVKAAIQKNDQRAYTRLMEKYKQSIYYMVLKMVHNRDDAEDLTLEAFNKAFTNMEKYSSDYAFSTWLFKIATNNCIDFIRKKRIQTVSMDDPINEHDGAESATFSVKDEGLDPEERYIKDQKIKQIREIAESLNPKYKQLIQLRYFEELSYDEISDQLKLPIGTVKAQLFRAKKLLEDMLSQGTENF